MVLLLAVGGAAAGVWWLLQQQTPDEEQPIDTAHASILNYRFVFPRGWRVDNKIKQGLGANLAISRTEPSVGLAIFARDYKTRSPRNAELHDQAVAWMEKYFRGFEYAAKADSKLDNQTARMLEFQGELDHVLVNGECVMTSRRGYAYWVIVWGAAERREAAAMEWQIARDCFQFLGNREGWAEKKPRQVLLQGEKAACRLSYAEGVWEMQSDDGLDTAVDILLRGYDPRDTERLAEKAGIVMVVKLPQSEGDLKAAAANTREYLLKKQKELYPETILEAVADKSDAADGSINLGGFRGHFARFRMKNSPQRELYVELVTVPLSDGILVMQCECLWARREFFKQEFAPLRESLRIGKSK
jgi:hypothetical protein